METIFQVAAAGGRMEDLYSAHGRDAVRLAYLLTGNKADAEDLAHEAFARIMGRFGDLRKPDAFRAYLMRTVVNLVKSRHRRSATERRYQSAMATSAVARPPDLELHDALWQELARLPERQRVALVLRYCEDLSLEQTAEIMRTSTKAVKSLVARGLEGLRKREVSFL